MSQSCRHVSTHHRSGCYHHHIARLDSCIRLRNYLGSERNHCRLVDNLVYISCIESWVGHNPNNSHLSYRVGTFTPPRTRSSNPCTSSKQYLTSMCYIMQGIVCTTYPSTHSTWASIQHCNCWYMTFHWVLELHCNWNNWWVRNRSSVYTEQSKVDIVM